jgi:membrane protein
LGTSPIDDEFFVANLKQGNTHQGEDNDSLSNWGGNSLTNGEAAMRLRTYPNTPLWFDLLLAIGAIALAHRLDQFIQPPRRAPRFEEAFPPENRERSYQDNKLNLGKGAMGRRPSQEPHSLQQTRAEETGRGRSARSPITIPGRGWKDILWRTYTQIGDDRLLAVAAGAVFYLLLALVPAITALVSLYGLLTDPGIINDHLLLLQGVVPEGAIAIVKEQVTRLTQTSNSALGLGFFLGLALALWSANAGMKAVIDALNVVYDEREERGFVKLTLVALAFTLGSLAFIILALGAVVAFPLALAWIGFESRAAELIAILRWPALFVIVMLGLAVLYRYGPNRTPARWRWLSIGTLLATLAWLAISALFSWYLANFAHYDATYGSLGGAIGLMMWLWLSVVVILIGGELNAEMEHQTARDTTIGQEKPLGMRGAVMADTLGEAWH